MDPDESEKDTMDVQSALDVGVVEPACCLYGTSCGSCTLSVTGTSNTNTRHERQFWNSGEGVMA